MSENLKDPGPRGALVSACGLFCGNCGRLRSGKCPGCRKSPIFKKCPVRRCCVERGIAGCFECADFKSRDFAECKKVNSRLARIIAYFTKSDRPAALRALRDHGIKQFVEDRKLSGKM